MPKAEWVKKEQRACRRFGWDGVKTSWIYFSTEQARDEYINQNKPRFSLKEIKEQVRFSLNYLSDELQRKTITIQDAIDYINARMSNRK